MYFDNIRLGIVIAECAYSEPCDHCLAYSTLKGHGSLDFYLLKKIVAEAEEADISIRDIAISGGEPLIYNSEGRNLADVVSLFSDDSVISIATDIVAEKPELVKEIANRNEHILWRLSYNMYSKQDPDKKIRRNIDALIESGIPPSFEFDGYTGLSKDIQVTGVTHDKSIDLMYRLASIFPEYELEKEDRSNYVLARPDKRDAIDVSLSAVAWHGEARKNISIEQLDPRAHGTCPLLGNDGNSISVINSGYYDICEPIVNPAFRIGPISDLTLPEALTIRNTTIVKAIATMLSANPDFSAHAGQPCAYCEDHLGEFLGSAPETA